MTKKIDLPGPFTVSGNYKDACLNALIYSWKKEDFRRGLKDHLEDAWNGQEKQTSN